MFLPIKSFFAINPGCLSSALCDLWSLDVAVSGWARTPEAGDLTLGLWTTRELPTPWNINRCEPSQRLPINTKAKPYSKASKLRDGCAMPILQLNRSTTLHISRQAAQSHSKPTDTPKHTTGQGTALQRDKIQLHPWEHKHKSPHPENLHNALIRPHKLEYSLHN